MPDMQINAAPLLEARNLVQEFTVRGYGGIKGGSVRAVSDVSFSIAAGETLGIVGESGSGKSTLARALLQLPRPQNGSVLFRGEDMTQLRGRQLLRVRRDVQMVFQDPLGSLDPTWRVDRIVEEPLIGYRVGDGKQRRRKVGEVLERVGLPLALYGRRRPHELSGGQCQRVAIARSLALDPALIICDEVLSALDVLMQAQLVNLFAQLQAERGLSYLFISHDLALVKQVSDRVGVLHLGQLCEIGPSKPLYRSPLHPYTAMLFAAGVPRGRAANPVPHEPPEGELPSPLNPPSGCRFRTRCPRAQQRCAAEQPALRELREGHRVACHFPLEGATVAPPVGVQSLPIPAAQPTRTSGAMSRCET